MPTKNASGEPGATLFYLCLVLASCVAAFEATRIRGLGQASGAATVPLIASGLMLLTTSILLVRSVLAREAGFLPSLSAFRGLLPLPILGYMAFCALFVGLIEVVGFWIAAAGFLPVSFVALNRSGPVRAVLLAAGTLVVVYIVFVYLFSIYLP